MKKRLLSTVIISSLALLTACGSSSVAPPTLAPAVYTVKGTVPGTLIEAFCDNGSYYSATSVQNGTNQHPFEIELPGNLGCNLVMTTNENDPANTIITPIGFRDANGDISTRFSASTDTVIDIGNISLFIDVTAAAAFDSNNDSVIDVPYDAGVVTDLTIATAGATTLDPDADGIIEPYDDEDDDGIINRDDPDYSNLSTDSDRDGLPDSIDVNPDNDENASNTYPEVLDSDGDGYLDDDLNQDGFHDDDQDLDGFHDDDLDQDGFSDDDADHDGISDNDPNDDPDSHSSDDT